MKFEIPENVKPLTDFLIHVLVGGAALVFIVLVEVAVAGCIKVIAFLPIAPSWLMNGAAYGEKALFGLEGCLFGLFLLTEAIKLIRGLWKELQHG